MNVFRQIIHLTKSAHIYQELREVMKLQSRSERYLTSVSPSSRPLRYRNNTKERLLGVSAGETANKGINLSLPAFAGSADSE